MGPVEQPRSADAPPLRAGSFASLKKEEVHDADFASRADAQTSIVEYAEVFYNNQCRHLSLGHVTPAGYERQNS